MKSTVRYFSSYSDDFAQTKNQNYKLPKDYKWLKTNLFSRFLSGFYYTLAVIFSTVYCRVFLHMRIKNAAVLRRTKNTGVFIYGNHTQEIGDVFIPALAALPKRIYTVVSAANLGIPVLGKILPYLGALPLPDSVTDMKKLMEAMEYRLNQNKCVVIYPEAHVWKYCTEIRPFEQAAFRYPVKYQKPVFCTTVTYQKRRFFKKPKMTVFVDGPFLPDSSLSPKEQASVLKEAVYGCMKDRSRSSNCEYYKYVKININ